MLHVLGRVSITISLHYVTHDIDLDLYNNICLLSQPTYRNPFTRFLPPSFLTHIASKPPKNIQTHTPFKGSLLPVTMDTNPFPVHILRIFSLITLCGAKLRFSSFSMLLNISPELMTKYISSSSDV